LAFVGGAPLTVTLGFLYLRPGSGVALASGYRRAAAGVSFGGVRGGLGGVDWIRAVLLDGRFPVVAVPCFNAVASWRSVHWRLAFAPWAVERGSVAWRGLAAQGASRPGGYLAWVARVGRSGYFRHRSPG